MINKTSLRAMTAMILLAALSVLSGCSSTGYNAASADKTSTYGSHDGWRNSSVAH